MPIPLLAAILPMLGSIGGSMAARSLATRLLGPALGRAAGSLLGRTALGATLGSKLGPLFMQGDKLGYVGGMIADLLGVPLGSMVGKLAAGEEIQGLGTEVKESLPWMVGFGGADAVRALGGKVLPSLAAKIPQSVGTGAHMILGSLLSHPAAALLDSEAEKENDNARNMEKAFSVLPQDPAPVTTMIASEKMKQGFDNAELAMALDELGVSLDDLAPMMSTDRFNQIF